METVLPCDRTFQHNEIKYKIDQRDVSLSLVQVSQSEIENFFVNGSQRFGWTPSLTSYQGLILTWLDQKLKICMNCLAQCREAIGLIFIPL